jgi:hypothetical protein
MHVDLRNASDDGGTTQKMVFSLGGKGLSVVEVARFRPALRSSPQTH